MNSKPRLDVVIVNWNAGGQLRLCLESVAAASQHEFVLSRVVVVDNASFDGSSNKLDDIQIPLLVVRNSQNRGFAAACNQGAQNTGADYLLFLNPDTMLDNDSLDASIRFLQRPQNGKYGICSIQLLDENGNVSRSCSRFLTPRNVLVGAFGLNRLFPGCFRGHIMEEWPHDTDRQVDHVIGAFYLVRRELFEILNGFDERFFVYLEDLDFSRRASQAGFAVYYLVSARALHRGGGTSQNIKATRLFYSLRSRLIYSVKHFDLLSLSLVLVVTVCVELFVRIANASASCSWSQVSETTRAYWMLWRALPQILRSLKQVRAGSGMSWVGE